MTLIIGILCSDGVVIGSDGAATYGNLGTKTIVQPTGKISIKNGLMIMGVSGPVGLGQCIVAEISNLWTGQKFKDKQDHEVMRIVRQTLWSECIEAEYKVAKETQHVLGVNLASQSAISHTVLAMPVRDAHVLYTFNEQAAPEQATPELPFISCGSGQGIADPFLAFIRRIFWPEDQPNVPEGIFAALWTLEHAIKVHPGGVSEPIQIAVLQKDGKHWVAQLLDEDDLAEHRQFIAQVEIHLSNFREPPEEVGEEGEGGPPEPPEAA